MDDDGGGGAKVPDPPPIYAPPEMAAAYSSFDANREKMRRSKMGNRKSLAIPKSGVASTPTTTPK